MGKGKGKGRGRENKQATSKPSDFLIQTPPRAVVASLDALEPVLLVGVDGY
jgi:hypothetical protein